MSFFASDVISKKRIPIETPSNIIDENGNCIFGTFKSEFPNMNFLDVNKPTNVPNALNKFRLTLWEAAEVHIKDSVLLCAVCDMGLFGMILCVYYDKKTKLCRKWSRNLTSGNTVLSPNLINNSVSCAYTDNGYIEFKNDFSNGSAFLKGSLIDKTGVIEFEFEMNRISDPSVVCIPFDKNRPLYSQKDFFKSRGYLLVDGYRVESDGDTYSIIDDHKGYYPRKAHYDWVTTMGKLNHNGELIDFAFNLTENQSINQNDYNENVIWLDNKCVLLPPVKFGHNLNEPNEIWHVNDEFGLVDINFKVYDKSSMVVNAAVVKIDYHIAFGEIFGKISDGNGTVYFLDGMLGIGEDKTLLF